MPTVKQVLDIEAPRDRIWKFVSDPYMLPRWWPRVQRVEEVQSEAWTIVLTSDSGKPIRADYTRVRYRPPELIEWRQELDETPFERMLSEARVVIELFPEHPDDQGLTGVSITTVERLRGLSRLGRFWVKRAAKRRLDEALSQLDEAVSG